MLRTLVIIAAVWALGAVLARLFRGRLPAGLRSRWVPAAAAVSLILFAEMQVGRTLPLLDHLIFYAVIAAAAAASFLVVPRFYGPMVNIAIASLLLGAGLVTIYFGEEMKRVIYIVLAAVSGFLFFKSLRPDKGWPGPGTDNSR
jgi:hypothetical protein